jgi:hypothetical protein
MFPIFLSSSPAQAEIVITDIQAVDLGTLPGGAETVKGRINDVDDDGDWDLVFKVKTPQTGIACGDTEATLTAQTLDGDAITGTDTLKTVGCNNN